MNAYKVPFRCDKGHKVSILEVAVAQDGTILFYGYCVMCGRDDICTQYSMAGFIAYAATRDKEEEETEDLSLRMLREFQPKGKPS